jgi:cephalosporin hydroxylase
MTLPPRVEVQFDRAGLRDYWIARVAQHTSDSYVGVPLSKFPEDLRVYEHLLWESAANVVIEIGAEFGGSSLWFRDRLKTMVGYGRIAGSLVISIDIDARAALANTAAVDPTLDSLITIEGDVTDPGLPERIEELLPTGARCLVVEDSAHVYDTTRAALEGFSRFVPLGGFFVVEDGCVDIEALRLAPDWPRGVLPALSDWLATPDGHRFTVRQDLELYGMSCHPGGFLQRVAGGPR